MSNVPCNCPAGTNPSWVGPHYTSCWTHRSMTGRYEAHQELLALRLEVAAWRALAELGDTDQLSLLCGHVDETLMVLQFTHSQSERGFGRDYGAAAVSLATKLQLIPSAPKSEATTTDPEARDGGEAGET